MINVCYSSSDSYSWIMTISLVSLLENNKDEEFNVFILDNGISEFNKKKILSLKEKYNTTISFVNINDKKSIIGDIKIHDRWDFATFGRLFESKILPIEIEKVIHIDCDTIINGSISSLWDIDLDNCAVAGVKDCLSKRYNKCIGTSYDNPLLNAGLLVFNLKYMRLNKIFEKFLDEISKSNRLMYLDQDIVNKCILKNEKLILNPKYNFYSLLTYCDYKELMTCRNPHNYYSYEEINEAKNNPIIIHFTSCSFDNGRPWNDINKHPLKDMFIRYKKLSPYFDYELIKINKSKKISFINNLPKFLSLRIARFLNAFAKPTFKKNK